LMLTKRHSCSFFDAGMLFSHLEEEGKRRRGATIDGHLSGRRGQILPAGLASEDGGPP
jgi:hypothetical protein